MVLLTQACFMCYEGLMLNKKSNHPEHMKQACVCNTIQTYTAICSTDGLLEEAEQTFKRRAIRNGYDSSYIDQTERIPPHIDYPVCFKWIYE